MSGPATHRARRRLHWLDFVVVFAVLAVVAYVAFRVDSVLRYNWNWSQVWPFIFYYDEETREWVANLLTQGVMTSIRLALWGIVIAGIIGTVLGAMRTSTNLFLRMVSRVYVEFVRNMPPIVFIFIFYFFISSQITPLLGIDDFARNASEDTRAIIAILCGDPLLFSNFISGLICLSLFEAAYIAEIVRAGIQSIPKGQWEAGNSIGLSRIDVFRFVILPQALQRIVPPLANQFITLIKDSSIVSLISIQELTFMAIEVGVSTTRVFEVWTIVAFLYFVVCYGCAVVFARLEIRMARSRR